MAISVARVGAVVVPLVPPPPHLGQVVVTQSVAPPSGEVPLGFRSEPFSMGRVTGSWSSGTGTSPSTGQWMMGIGGPQ